MSQLIENNKQLDSEWIKLIQIAKEMGIPKKDILAFLRKNQ
ncbi:anti-repressor SinI family protein [Bacillus massilioanorexius]|nr:anti-repressor SinI family protein [Bacillus massilioanorexius]